jgi:hypothetical protein
VLRFQGHSAISPREVFDRYRIGECIRKAEQAAVEKVQVALNRYSNSAADFEVDHEYAQSRFHLADTLVFIRNNLWFTGVTLGVGSGVQAMIVARSVSGVSAAQTALAATTASANAGRLGLGASRDTALLVASQNVQHAVQHRMIMSLVGAGVGGWAASTVTHGLGLSASPWQPHDVLLDMADEVIGGPVLSFADHFAGVSLPDSRSSGHVPGLAGAATLLSQRIQAIQSELSQEIARCHASGRN